MSQSLLSYKALVEFFESQRSQGRMNGSDENISILAIFLKDRVDNKCRALITTKLQALKRGDTFRNRLIKAQEAGMEVLALVEQVAEQQAMSDESWREEHKRLKDIFEEGEDNA